MRIIIIEDKLGEIKGSIKTIDVNKWEYIRWRTFAETYRKLTAMTESLDLFVIDIMLPWGDQDVKHVAKKAGIDWKRSGLLLINAIRHNSDKGLDKIISETNQRKSVRASEVDDESEQKELLGQRLAPKLPERYKKVPIIALTKVAETVEETLEDAPGILLASKATLGTDKATFGSIVEKMCERQKRE